MTVPIDAFLSLRNNFPVIDVRSELEYGQGHIPQAVNIPLLNNDERRIVGTTYKQQGQAEAIRAGFRLVGPRLDDIIESVKAYGNEVLVHCWRGGMRSSNFCQFLNMAKIKTHQLKGGYKAYRQMAFESFKRRLNLFTITGYTGSGKTEVLQALAATGEQILDLEKIARHKGSVFGGLQMLPQPTTEQFQNELFEAILKLDLSRRIWVEDESIAIGEIFLPEDLWRQMTKSTLVQLDVAKEIRVDRLVNEYGAAGKVEFLECMKKITKKLGGQHFIAAKEKLLSGDMSSVIAILLNYYDKAYHNGLEKKKKRIKFYSPWNGTDVHVFAAHLIKQADTLHTFA